MYQKVVRADILMLRADTITLRSRTLILRSDRLQTKSDNIKVFFDTLMGGDPKKGSLNYLFNPSKYLDTSSSYDFNTLMYLSDPYKGLDNASISMTKPNDFDKKLQRHRTFNYLYQRREYPLVDMGGALSKGGSS